MSFVNVVPELVQAAAQDLTGIGSTLGEATAFAAGPTTQLPAAGADEVSAAIAGLFGNHGQQFQALAARASTFHEQFVSLLSRGAGEYLSTEVANGEQMLTSAVSGPGQSLGGAASQLSGRIESGVQAISGAVTRMPANLKAFETSLPLLGNPSNIAAIEAPYQTLIANTEANLQSISKAMSANPAPLLHQIISNQTGYAQTVATALQNAGKDFGTGVAGLQTSFQAAGQALQAGNFTGASADVFEGLGKLLITGFTAPPVTGTSPVTITPTGTLGDLLPILGIPSQMVHNFANTVDTLTNFSTTFDPNTFGITFGLPLQLTLDALGSPITTITAMASSAQTVTGALQAGNLLGAIDGIVDAPAVIANGFLNGQTMLTLPSLTLDLFGFPLTTAAQVPFSGILAPLSPLTIDFEGIPLQLLDGTHIGGIIPALTGVLPEQLAEAIGASAPE